MADRAYLKVRLIGKTVATPEAEEIMAKEDGVFDPDYLEEIAGRLCYEAWAKARPETATNVGYLGNIIEQRHFSVVSHPGLVFHIEGISRSLGRELIRSRWPGFSEVSQRYVKPDNFRYVVPPAYEGDEYLETAVKLRFERAIREYKLDLSYLEGNKGLTGKRARQAARNVLPNCTETKFVFSANLRALRDLFAQRITVHADEEIYRLCVELLRRAQEEAPNTFQDWDDALDLVVQFPELAQQGNSLSH